MDIAAGIIAAVFSTLLWALLIREIMDEQQAKEQDGARQRQ